MNFIEMWNSGASVAEIATSERILHASVVSRAGRMIRAGLPLKRRHRSLDGLVRFETVKHLIDWRDGNKEIACQTGLKVDQVAWYRAKQPAPLSRPGAHGPRKRTPDELIRQYPLVKDQSISLESLASTYRMTYQGIQYITKRLGLPRRRKGRKAA